MSAGAPAGADAPRSGVGVHGRHVGEAVRPDEWLARGVVEAAVHALAAGLERTRSVRTAREMAECIVIISF